MDKEKLDWLKSIGAIDISKYDYMVPINGHLYSKEYLESKTLEEIKTKYKLLYSNKRDNNFFGNRSN